MKDFLTFQFLFFNLNKQLQEQLKYKDEVIEKYKSLLKIMPDQSDAERINDNSLSIMDDLARRKLRTSNEILLQNYGSDIEAKDMEIVKLRNEIEQFIKANRKLTNDLQQFHNQTKDCVEISTQTDFFVTINDDEIMEEIISNEMSILPNTIEESRKCVTNQDPSTITQIRTSSSSLQFTTPIEVTDMQNNDILMETLRREESKTMIMRMEIRELKQRIATLHTKNQV